MGDNKVGWEELKMAELLMASNKLIEGLNIMVNHMVYVRNREIQHHNLVKIFQRVVWWTNIEVIGLIVVVSGQFMYLRKVFE